MAAVVRIGVGSGPLAPPTVRLGEQISCGGWSGGLRGATTVCASAALHHLNGR